MENVLFTTLEHSDDIIISLSCDEESTFGVDGFTIVRTPKYEPFLAPDERGACIEWDDDDVRVMLDQVFVDRGEVRIVTRGRIQEYRFDIRRITDEEYDDLVKHFHLINFDKSIRVEVE